MATSQLELKTKKEIAGRIQQTISNFNEPPISNSAFEKILEREKSLAWDTVKKWVPPPSFWTWNGDRQRWTSIPKRSAEERSLDWDVVRTPGGRELRRFCEFTHVDADFILFGTTRPKTACDKCGRAHFHQEFRHEVWQRLLGKGATVDPGDELNVQAALSRLADLAYEEAEAIRKFRLRSASLKDVARRHPAESVELLKRVREDSPKTQLITPMLPRADGTMMEEIGIDPR
jgi:hypothetical protein